MNAPHTEENPGRSVGSMVPPLALRSAMRETIWEHGEERSAAKLGLSRSTVRRIAAGQTCRRGSLLLAAHTLGIDVTGVDSVAQ